MGEEGGGEGDRSEEGSRKEDPEEDGEGFRSGSNSHGLVDRWTGGLIRAIAGA